MRIAMINGSPKVNETSSSGELLRELKKCISGEVAYSDYTLRKSVLAEHITKELDECSVLVFAFPLYVDGIPSQLLSCLVQLEQVGFANKDIIVYGIVNSGFYEGKQNAIALEILQNWCNKTGLKWGAGVGVGGGGGLAQMTSVPLGKGMKSSLGKAFNTLGESIMSMSTIENIYISIHLPRWFYKIMAEIGWKTQLKKTGDKTKKLGHRY